MNAEQQCQQLLADIQVWQDHFTKLIDDLNKSIEEAKQLRTQEATINEQQKTIQS